MEAIVPGGDARALALLTLIDYEKRDAYPGALLSSRLGRSRLDRRDKAFVVELVQGVLRMKSTLDWMLAGFSRRPIETLDPGVRWALRLSAYQIRFTSVPDYAAVDMTARATAEVIGRHAVGYVNAVMRAFLKGFEDVRYPDKSKDQAGYLEARYSHPEWIAEMWVRELGFDRAESVCAADNTSPPLSLRTNLFRVTRERLSASLREKGIEVAYGELTDECVNVKGSGPLSDLEEFKRGWFTVQDQGSQIVSHLLDPRGGMSVLDMCAAPGGKANHIAELMGNEGSVLALDSNGARLRMVGETAERLGNTCVSTMEIDAAVASDSIDRVFDRVLLDAPCSGLGTLARRPDARWRKQPGDIDRLASLQTKLLAQAARMVAPGGLLVYSTCTISQRENAGVVGEFMKNARGFVGETRLQLFPDTHRCDGMFAAVMRKNA
ncbi:MAG: 16S rRNA (cytosine(967)-C(5))-methyltransferase RsmB [Candidatus Anoxymicrobium japonicum]|uniref:16S rRNA (cytosine(967)-C(5))-methyltransferase n=1 Tax=Candidatus Anoxymicrobium japonicum TaxID=2013648 RepID=A0A2N3G6G7_9ACTN|nr:MAG: 16S rRNA (cytosine(967)-C(5))-methyltransferase RsmB [Candidatus Anoxymicrobium japonicum]